MRTGKDTNLLDGGCDKRFPAHWTNVRRNLIQQCHSILICIREFIPTAIFTMEKIPPLFYTHWCATLFAIHDLGNLFLCLIINLNSGVDRGYVVAPVQ